MYIGRHSNSLITRRMKVNPKSIEFAEKLLKKYKHLTKIYKISLHPLFNNQFTSKSTKKWVNLELSKLMSWRSATDNHKYQDGPLILRNEVNVPIILDIINASKVQLGVVLLKNHMQDQKLNQRHLIEREYVQKMALQTPLSLLPHKQFISALTKNRKRKDGSQIQTSEVEMLVFSDLINGLMTQPKTDLTKNRMPAQKVKKEHLIESEVIHHQKSDSEINTKSESLEKRAEQSSYFYLDSSLKNFMAGILKIHIPSVKIYANKTSDTLAKQFNADALTYKNNIFFKTGKYNPRDKKGLALLGHELTHAAQTKMQNQNLVGSKMANYECEEREAIGNEKSVLRYFRSVEPYSMDKRFLYPNFDSNSFKEYRFNSETYRSFKGSENPTTFLGNSTSTSNRYTQTQVPRAALTSRDLNLPLETSTNSSSAFMLSEQQLRLIKDEMYRDIMNRIRSEFERGG